MFRLNQLGSRICLMTYHSPIFELYGAKRVAKLFEFMEIIRGVSRSENTYLIDTLPLWEDLRKKHPLIHKSLLSDEIHLNRLGNLLLGLIITNALGLELSEQDTEYWTSAKDIYRLVVE